MEDEIHTLDCILLEMWPIRVNRGIFVLFKKAVIYVKDVFDGTAVL